MHFYLEGKNDIKYVLRWHSVYSPILHYCKVLYLATDWLVDYVELSRCLFFLTPSFLDFRLLVDNALTQNEIGSKAWVMNQMSISFSAFLIFLHLHCEIIALGEYFP